MRLFVCVVTALSLTLAACAEPASEAGKQEIRPLADLEQTVEVAATATLVPPVVTPTTPPATRTATAVIIPPTAVPQLALPTATAAATTAQCPQGCTAQQPGCNIKGNINAEGEKIYHVPGGGSYNATVISPQNGERWFCTGQEAVANGWRAARN